MEMKLSRPLLAASVIGFAVLAGPAQSFACTATGFVRDSINLTAALVNPANVVRGDVDATGCNIGIYYSSGNHGRVDGANVHGANYFGIVNDGASVDIKNSNISDIGEKPFNGTQHGVAIYFAFGTSARGDIINNTVWSYQKGGIVVNGPDARSNIRNNTVIGLGPVNFIAQNGIQVGYGANANVTNNFVSGNSYTGAGLTASGGIILVGGDCYGGDPTTNVAVANNDAINNDVGIWLANLDASCAAVATPTKNSVFGNSVASNAVNNTTGNGATQGYQAGIADQGDRDSIVNNDICGSGYQPPGTPSAALFAVDLTATNNPTAFHNTTCQDHGWWWWPNAATAAKSSRARIGHHTAPSPHK
jgi:hypothetical protein